MVCNPKHEDALVPSWGYAQQIASASAVLICMMHICISILTFPFVDISKLGQARLRTVFIKIGEKNTSGFQLTAYILHSHFPRTTPHHK